MKIIAMFFSVLLVICSIAALLAALYNCWPIVEFVFGPYLSPRLGFKGTIPVTAVGTVVSSTSSIHHSRIGTTDHYTESKETEIDFKDDQGRLFRIACEPVILSFKENKKIKVRYYAFDCDKESADKEKLEPSPRPINVNGVPLSIFFLLERPLIFLFVAFIALVISPLPRAVYGLSHPAPTQKETNKK